MKTKQHPTGTRWLLAVVSIAAVLLTATPTLAGEYAALNDVKELKAVFDVSQGNPQKANAVFWAVRNVYDDGSTRALPQKTKVAVVFRGPAVKLLSSERKGFTEAEKKALDKFTGMIRKMKQEGVTFEVCGYALSVLGVDPATVLPEVDQVGNGFISVAGYQAQGYSVITIN